MPPPSPRSRGTTSSTTRFGGSIAESRRTQPPHSPLGGHARRAGPPRARAGELHHGGRRLPAAGGRRALPRRPPGPRRPQAPLPRGGASAVAAPREPRVRGAAGGALRARSDAHQPRELPPGHRRPLALAESPPQPPPLPRMPAPPRPPTP